MVFKFKELAGKNIVIEGLIGVGKTTLVAVVNKWITENPDLVFKSHTIEEKISKAMLTVYYPNMKLCSREAQNMCMQEAQARMENANELKKEGGVVWVDCGTLRTKAFARSLLDQKLLSQHDFDRHIWMHTKLMELTPPPDLVVYLEVSAQIAMERIKKRARPSEKSITDDYLNHLDTHYRTVLKEAEVEGWNVLYLPYEKYFNPPEFVSICIEALREKK